MALPVQLDSVPVGQLADLGDALQAEFPNLGDGEVPGGREPLGSLAGAQAPLRVLLAQGSQSFDAGLGHVLELQAAEVVVVHADGGVDMHSQLMTPLHQGGIGILALAQQFPDAFVVPHGPHRVVEAALGVARHFDGLGGPLGLVLAGAPEVSPHLGVLHGSVCLFHELLHRLRVLGVIVRGSVPVVDDRISRWPVFDGSLGRTACSFPLQGKFGQGPSPGRHAQGSRFQKGSSVEFHFGDSFS